MDAVINGIVTGVKVGQKTFNGQVKLDRNKNPEMERKIMILDLDDTKATEPYKINFPQEMEDLLCVVEQKPDGYKSYASAHHGQLVTAHLEVGQFNKYTFFRLKELKLANS